MAMLLLADKQGSHAAEGDNMDTDMVVVWFAEGRRHYLMLASTYTRTAVGPGPEQSVGPAVTVEEQ